jgi:hypothetical protein
MMKPRGRPFLPSNTFGRGRPKGSRNKTALAAQQLLDEYGEALTRKCVLQALQGDKHAMRLCMERVLPVRREAAVRLKLPPVATARGVAAAEQEVVHNIASGRITPGEGEKTVNVLERLRKSIETDELLARIEKVESAVEGRAHGEKT